jgi:hypothetical protein
MIVAQATAGAQNFIKVFERQGCAGNGLALALNSFALGAVARTPTSRLIMLVVAVVDWVLVRLVVLVKALCCPTAVKFPAGAGMVATALGSAAAAWVLVVPGDEVEVESSLLPQAANRKIKGKNRIKVPN